MLKHCHTDTFEPSESERWTVPRIQERPPRHLLVTTVPTLGCQSSMASCEMHWNPLLVGGWPTPLKEYEFVSWDDSQLLWEKYQPCSSHHQPDYKSMFFFVTGHLLKWVIYGELVGASAVSSFTAYGTSSHPKSSQVIVSFPMKRPMEGWSPVIGGSQNVLPPALDLQYSSWSSWSSWFTTVKSMWNPCCPTVDALKKLGWWLVLPVVFPRHPMKSHCLLLKILTKSPIISYQIPCCSPLFTSTNDWLVVQCAHLEKCEEFVNGKTMTSGWYPI